MGSWFTIVSILSLISIVNNVDCGNDTFKWMFESHNHLIGEWTRLFIAVGVVGSVDAKVNWYHLLADIWIIASILAGPRGIGKEKWSNRNLNIGSFEAASICLRYFDRIYRFFHTHTRKSLQNQLHSQSISLSNFHLIVRSSQFQPIAWSSIQFNSDAPKKAPFSNLMAMMQLNNPLFNW